MKRVYATLSADVVDSTSLSTADVVRMKECLEQFLPVMKSLCDEAWGRVVRGDSLECVIPDARLSLRIALMLKCYVKSAVFATGSPLLRKKGIKVVLGLGSLRINDEAAGIIDGEAIYESGRMLDKGAGGDATLLSLVSNELDVRGYSALCDVLGFILKRATGRQCRVLYFLLLGRTQQRIASELGLEQPTVNQHANAVGWNAIQRALARFESEHFVVIEEEGKGI